MREIPENLRCAWGWTALAVELERDGFEGAAFARRYADRMYQEAMDPRTFAERMGAVRETWDGR